MNLSTNGPMKLEDLYALLMKDKPLYREPNKKKLKHGVLYHENSRITYVSKVTNKRPVQIMNWR